MSCLSAFAVRDRSLLQSLITCYRATAMLSAVYTIAVCLCVCHTLVLYQNG